MLKCSIFIIALVFSTILHGQASIIDDYLKLENVKVLVKEEKYNKAIAQVELIENNKIFIAGDLILVGSLYLKIGDTIRAKKKVFESVLKGAELNWLNSYPQLKSIITKADSLYFKNTYQQEKNKMDIEVYSSIYAMFQLDQYVRERWLRSRDTVDLIAMNTIDSMNAIKVYDIIDKHGWLGHNYFSIEQLFFPLFLHTSAHTMDSAKFEVYKKKLYQEVLNGNMTPSTYAIWVDRHLVFVLKERPLYGVFWKRTENGRELGMVQHPKKIDEIRHSIGLMSLAQYAKYKPDIILPNWYAPAKK